MTTGPTLAKNGSCLAGAAAERVRGDRAAAPNKNMRRPSMIMTRMSQSWHRRLTGPDRLGNELAALTLRASVVGPRLASPPRRRLGPAGPSTFRHHADTLSRLVNGQQPTQRRLQFTSSRPEGSIRVPSWLHAAPRRRRAGDGDAFECFPAVTWPIPRARDAGLTPTYGQKGRGGDYVFALTLT